MSSLPKAVQVDAATPPAPVLRARAVALLAVLLLFSLGLVWEIWLAPTGRGTWALKVLPLLAAPAGMLHHRLYTFRWMSLLVWLYATEGVLRASTERGIGQGLALAQTALALLLFGACVVYIRLRLRRPEEPPA